MENTKSGHHKEENTSLNSQEKTKRMNSSPGSAEWAKGGQMAAK